MKKNAGISYPITIKDNSRSISIVTDDEYIRQSLLGVSYTTKGELLGDPEFGSNFLLFLFETNIEALIDILANEIIEMVSRYLPQITLNKNGITGESIGDTLRLRVSYSYIGGSSTSVMYIDLQGGSE